MLPMALTLRQVRYFIATAEFGQISQAAIHLNISQSAVTSAIQELESMLGVALFTRTAQGMNLTDSGRHFFLNHAYSIQRSVDDALNSPQPDTRVEGTLKVAASYTVMGYFLPHHLQRLAQWYPELELQLFEDERASIERGLLDGRYDIAVLLTGNLTEPGIAAETLFNSERRLWLPSRHPLGEKADLGLADVAGEPYIMLTVDEAGQSALRYWQQSGHRPQVILHTSSVEAVRSMVANGSGVAILSDLVYRPWSLEGKRIETLSLVDPVPSMSVGLAWRRDTEASAGMRAFREYFRQSFLAPQQSSSRR
ncbi:LysR family transcriptional regulator [Pseudomonas aeruginosa]|uniref:LysR family transcriptional regulator n=6 Tax=Gammaproteobacteria TaxID=1236 RepID=UPI000E31F434|nr:LysR family transcriptional regulator [Pseudomonas aeruginosa]MBT9307585.1 LysR family transcriptional regulator [Pseudomonas aeruginosa]RFJ38383.1 LysR family transcriptional regulator [Pseudomonas aeruginosa]RFL55606.1 LysR family transcriptional regulator [Pseudomonas aeruginosa]HBO5452409.1 LysR family transcriptional regulator [Pseudomonas aeruginosa]HBO6122556.1 LysR family transcriptional regulator [Pseudomonas aeruginosa]